MCVVLSDLVCDIFEINPASLLFLHLPLYFLSLCLQTFIHSFIKLVYIFFETLPCLMPWTRVQGHSKDQNKALAHWEFIFW